MSENFMKCHVIHLIKESVDLKNFKVLKKKGFTYSRVKCFLVEGSPGITAFNLFFFIYFCFSLGKVKKKHWRAFIAPLT